MPSSACMHVTVVLSMIYDTDIVAAVLKTKKYHQHYLCSFAKQLQQELLD